MLSTTYALIKKQFRGFLCQRFFTRASQCFFTAPQLIANVKTPFSSKPILILLFTLYLVPSLSLQPYSQPPAHTCCRLTFHWGTPQMSEATSSSPMWFCLTDTWLKYSSLWICPLRLTMLQDVFHNLAIPSLGSMVQQGAVIRALD